MQREDRPGAFAIRARRRAIGLTLVAAVALGACHGDDSSAPTSSLSGHGEANPGPLPTLVGGVDLPATPLVSLLGGQNLAYGEPLPSQTAAAQAFKKDPEVRDVLPRTVRAASTGERLGEVVLLRLDGKQIFDQGVLDELVRGLVATAGGAETIERQVGDVTVHSAIGPEQSAGGYRIGDLVVLVTSPTAAIADLIVDRGLAARQAGQSGSATPSTPLLPAVKIDGAFVPVPSVTFVPFPPPEEEEPPVAPGLPHATGVQGRYGVVAGERRTTAWAFDLDHGAYPTAEALAPALQSLVSSLAGGTKPKTTEVIDRVVYAADPPPNTPPPDPTDPGRIEPLVARAFVHGSLAIVVTGRDTAQVDAAISDWISKLS